MRLRLGYIIISDKAQRAFDLTQEGPARYLFRHARDPRARDGQSLTTTHYTKSGMDIAIYTAKRGGTFVCLLEDLPDDLDQVNKES